MGSSINDEFFKIQYDRYLSNLSLKEKVHFSKDWENSLGNQDASSLITMLFSEIKRCNSANMGCEECFECLDTALALHANFLQYKNYKVFTLAVYYFLLVRKELEMSELIQVTGNNSNYKEEKIAKVNSWDEYFLNVATQVASNSKCFSRKIGAIIVRDKTIIGTGYNSPPRGVPSCDNRWGHDISLGLKPSQNVINKCPRKILGYGSGEGVELCPASHAEESAIINSARIGICTKDAVMYLSCGIPCAKCATKIINAGICEVVVTSMSLYDKLSDYLFKHSDVNIRLYAFVPNKV